MNLAYNKILDQIQLRVETYIIKHTLVKPWLMSLNSPKETQEKTLLKILKSNLGTSFSDKYDFSSILDSTQYQERVPISNFEELRIYIEQLSPQMYLRTSGTTNKPKDIPLFSKTFDSYQKIQKISCYYQYQSAPKIFSGKVLGIVSPLIEGHLENGIAYGSMSGLVSQTLPNFVQKKLLLPSEILQIKEYEKRDLLIAALAFVTSDITCLASANPSTFLKLSQVINRNRELLTNILKTGDLSLLGFEISFFSKVNKLIKADQVRANNLNQIKGDLRFSDIWENLQAVLTWTSGNCSILIPKLKEQVSDNVKIMDLGYLASEFWGTIIVDHSDNSGVPTIEDYFFEFIETDLWDSGSKQTILIDQLELGKKYYIIVTTTNGLYRYFINDIIEVVGKYNNTPKIIFVQKGKGITSLTGEKLYESQITEAVKKMSELFDIEINNFLMLADKKSFSYVFYFESQNGLDILNFSAKLNEYISDFNVEYKSKVESGRLSRLRVAQLKSGTFEIYKKSQLINTVRDSQYKMLRLQYLDQVNFNFSEFECE